MTQATALLQVGADIAAQAAAAQFRTLAATLPSNSPLRPFFSSALNTWIDEQLKHGKSLDVVGALRTTQLESDGKAQANARLVKERDQLKARLDDTAGRLIALEQGKNLGIIRIKDGRDTYLLEEHDSEVTTTLQDGAWNGMLTFLLYSPILENAVFQRVLEVLFRSGFDGRIVGVPLKLTGVSIKRFIAKEEKDAHRGAFGIVKMSYTSLRAKAAGNVKAIDGGYEIVAAAV